MGELVATLIDGAGLQPKTEPRPVVNTSTFAPPWNSAAFVQMIRFVHSTILKVYTSIDSSKVLRVMVVC